MRCLGELNFDRSVYLLLWSHTRYTVPSALSAALHDNSAQGPCSSLLPFISKDRIILPYKHPRQSQLPMKIAVRDSLRIISDVTDVRRSFTRLSRYCQACDRSFVEEQDAVKEDVDMLTMCALGRRKLPHTMPCDTTDGHSIRRSSFRLSP